MATHCFPLISPHTLLPSSTPHHQAIHTPPSPPSINPSGRSIRQRITKSYQLKPCQISKHNHYVNPSFLLLHGEKKKKKTGLALSEAPLSLSEKLKRVIEMDDIGNSGRLLNLGTLKYMVQNTALSRVFSEELHILARINKTPTLAARSSSIIKTNRQEAKHNERAFRCLFHPASYQPQHR